MNHNQPNYLPHPGDFIDPGDSLHQALFFLMQAMVERDLVQPPLEHVEIWLLIDDLLTAKGEYLRNRPDWVLAEEPSA